MILRRSLFGECFWNLFTVLCKKSEKKGVKCQFIVDKEISNKHTVKTDLDFGMFKLSISFMNLHFDRPYYVLMKQKTWENIVKIV